LPRYLSGKSFQTEEPEVSKTSPPGLRRRTGPDGIGQLLRVNGYPYTDRTLENLCSPLIDEGPQPVSRWGREWMYSEEGALEWARERARKQFEDGMAKRERARAERARAIARRQEATA
jgi:hypothetical protein